MSGAGRRIGLWRRQCWWRWSGEGGGACWVLQLHFYLERPVAPEAKRQNINYFCRFLTICVQKQTKNDSLGKKGNGQFVILNSNSFIYKLLRTLISARANSSLWKHFQNSGVLLKIFEKSLVSTSNDIAEDNKSEPLTANFTESTVRKQSCGRTWGTA